MSVEAVDGGIGKVKEVADHVGGAYLVVDTGPWIFGKLVTLPAGVVTAVDTSDGTVFIDRTRDEVKDAPEFDPDAADDTAHREALTAHYGVAREGDFPAAAGAAPTLGGPDPEAIGEPGDADASLGGSTPAAAPFGATGDAEEGLGGTPAAAPTGATSDAEEGLGSTPAAAPTGTTGDAEEGLGGTPAAAPTGTTSDADEGLGSTPTGASGDAEEGLGSPWPSAAPDTEDAAPPTSSGVDLDTSEETTSERPSAAHESAEQPEAEIPSASESNASEGVGEASAETPDNEQATANRSTADADEESEETTPRRFVRDTDSSGSKSEGKSASKGRSRGGNGSSSRSRSGDVPIPRYDSLTAAEIIARLRNLSQRELAEVERYEKRNENRQTVLGRIDSLREKEPWRGYDDATVGEIKKKLTDADEDRAKAVRDYERRHRDRKGVMEAARRMAASA